MNVRPLNKKEVQADAAALTSIEKEWRRLRDRKARDQASVRERGDVAGEARRADRELHMGMLFGLSSKRTLTYRRGIRDANSKVGLFSWETMW